MKHEIKHRFTDAVLFTADIPEGTESEMIVRIALEQAAEAGADLRCANLRGANLSDANLSYAKLRGADLTPIRDDLWAVLSSSPAEVPALIAALRAGKVDGSTYEGECACLVGTLANARDVSYQSIQSLTPNPARPIEQFFMSIRKGDTPETNEFSKLALEWSQEWMDRMQAAFAAV